MKKLHFLQFNIIFLLMGSLYSCEENIEKPELYPEAQEIEFNIFYNGLADPVLPEWHNLYLEFYSENGEKEYSFFEEASKHLMKEGCIYEINYEFDPGKYYVKGYWDWLDNGIEDFYDPEILESFFEINEVTNLKFNLYLKNKVSATDKGWIIAKVIYDGTVIQNAPVYSTLRSPDLNIYVKNKISEATDLKTPIEFQIESLTPGRYILDVFWDTNFNGSKDESELWGVSFDLNFIYSGFPSFTEIEIKYN